MAELDDQSDQRSPLLMAAWLNERQRDGGVDEIPLPETVGGGGRLFLCGKHAIAPDPEALLSRVGATTVVCLNEPYELDGRYPEYMAWLAGNTPARAVVYPIPDLHAPAVDEFVGLIDDLQGRLAAGETLVVHCGAGIGRAGTVAVALLMRMGMPLDEALATVRRHRPMAGPEAGAQVEVLAALQRHLEGERQKAERQRRT